MKKLFIFLGFVMVSILGNSCVKKSDYLVDNYGLDNKHVIEEITPQKMQEVIEKDETCLMVFGFPACPWCQALMPVLDEVANDYSVKVYYIDLKDMRDNETSADKQYYDFLYSFANAALDTKNDRINAPTILSIKNGELINYHLDTVSTHVKNEAGVLPSLTEEQKSELVNIIKSLFDDCLN